MKNNTGLLHLYIGSGKGKTTAAVGLLTRAKGAGLRVLLVQFLKGQNSGELASLEQLGIPVWRATESKKFPFQMSADELDLCRHDSLICFERVSCTMQGDSYDLIVLDEVLDAVSEGLVEQQALLDALKCRSAHVEVVLTGRNPCDELRGMADYISEIRAVKHPYEKGIAPRQGIEY